MTISQTSTIMENFLEGYLRWAPAPEFLVQAKDPETLRDYLKSSLPAQTVLLGVPQLQELINAWREEKASPQSMLQRIQSLLGFDGTRAALAIGALGSKALWATHMVEWGEAHELPNSAGLWWTGWHYDLLLALMGRKGQNASLAKKVASELPAWIQTAQTSALPLHRAASKLKHLRHDLDLVPLWLLRPLENIFATMDAVRSETPVGHDSPKTRTVLWLDGVGVFRDVSWALYYLDEPLQLQPKDMDLFKLCALMRVQAQPSDPMIPVFDRLLKKSA